MQKIQNFHLNCFFQNVKQEINIVLLITHSLLSCLFLWNLNFWAGFLGMKISSWQHCTNQNGRFILAVKTSSSSWAGITLSSLSNYWVDDFVGRHYKGWVFECFYLYWWYRFGWLMKDAPIKYNCNLIKVVSAMKSFWRCFWTSTPNTFLRFLIRQWE